MHLEMGMRNSGLIHVHQVREVSTDIFFCQYFNTANQFIPDLPAGFLGQGPFREVRMLVDGQLAGVAYPYATIFTGGIVPTAWR